MFRVVLRQRMQQGAAVMSESGAVVISPFCIKADVHGDKDKCYFTQRTQRSNVRCVVSFRRSRCEKKR